MANYIVGMKQDIVWAYFNSLGAKSPLITIAIEDIEDLEMNMSDFLLDEVKTAEQKFSLTSNDRIYLRPYALESALENDFVSQQEYRKLIKILGLIKFSKQIVIGNVGYRSDSNHNKFLHNQIFGNDLEQKMVRLGKNHPVYEDVVVKSVSSLRVEVTKLDQFHKNIEDRSEYYTLLQRACYGAPLRVHVIGFDKLVATLFPQPTDSIDYRYSDEIKSSAQTVGVPFELDSELQERCLEIAHAYGLPLSGIDFIVKNGCYHFLEINPEPGWAYVTSNQCDQIAGAIESFMTRSDLNQLYYENHSSSDLRKMEIQCEVLSRGSELKFFPCALIPHDFIAKPNESHPFYTSGENQ